MDQQFFMEAMDAVGLKPIVIDENTVFPKAETPQSPFLPGTNIQFAWDSTSIGYLKTCPRLYQYTMIDGWTPKGEAIHLRFGIELHEALQDYENARSRGVDFEDALNGTVHALLTRIHSWDPDPQTKSEQLKSKAHLVRSVIWYLDKFRDDVAETHILENGKPAVELSFRFELDWGPKHIYQGLRFDGDGKATMLQSGQPYLLCGHLDRVVSYQGQLFVMDHKTTTSTPGSYYFNQFEPNNQMTLYTLASQVILGSPIKGVIIDAIQIAAGFTEFSRGFTYRTPDQLEEYTESLRFWFAAAEGYAQDNYWPMNDMSCDKFGGCKFRNVCSKSPQVRDAFLRSDFDQLPKEERWNPLKSR